MTAEEILHALAQPIGSDMKDLQQTYKHVHTHTCTYTRTDGKKTFHLSLSPLFLLNSKIND